MRELAVILKRQQKMYRSIYTTFTKNIFGLTKKELEEQYNYPNSDLESLAKKSSIKNKTKPKKQERLINF